MINILPDLVKFIKDNNKNGVCIKFSLGKYTNDFGFDNKLFNECNYSKIKSSLDSYDGWKESYEDIHKYTDECPQKIIDTMIIKNTGPYDIFITAETEDKVDIGDSNIFEINVHTYVLKRHTFVLKNYSYTIGDPKQVLEIYITDKNVSINYLAHSSLLKINDFMKIIKPVEDEFIMEILQKK